MSRCIKDLTGKRFGKLIALSLDTGPYKSFRKWLCQCDCGNTKVISGHLLGRKINSCGCIRASLNKTRDAQMIGRRFGSLVVVGFSGVTKKGNKRDGNRIYYCMCDCGNAKEILGSSLRAGTIKSCGCQSYRRKDLTGKRFGSWTVLYRSKTQKSRRTRWRCKCDCGVERDIIEFSLGKSSKSCGCASLYESPIATELKKYFVENYNGIAEWQVCKNPKTNYMLRCDIYLPKHKAYIEVNGGQHYNPKNSWNKKYSFIYRKSLDDLKKSFAKKNGNYVEIDLRKIKTVEEAIEYVKQNIRTDFPHDAVRIIPV